MRALVERVFGYRQLGGSWLSVAQRYSDGTRVKGKVVGLANYGAFVEVEPGVEGLVHVSEMSWVKRINHPSELLTLGDEVCAIGLCS
ncbi:MAG: S1 RNA-binding domain-containing protein [Myxococcota bacterium]